MIFKTDVPCHIECGMLKNLITKWLWSPSIGLCVQCYTGEDVFTFSEKIHEKNEFEIIKQIILSLHEYI